MKITDEIMINMQRYENEQIIYSLIIILTTSNQTCLECFITSPTHETVHTKRKSEKYNVYLNT